MPPDWLRFIVQFLAGFVPMILGLGVALYVGEKWLSTDERKQYVPGGAEVPVLKSKRYVLVMFLVAFAIFMCGAALFYYLIDTYWFEAF